MGLYALKNKQKKLAYGNFNQRLIIHLWVYGDGLRGWASATVVLPSILSIVTLLGLLMYYRV